MFIIFMWLVLLVTITLPICYRLSIIQKDIERITYKINNLTEKIGEEKNEYHKIKNRESRARKKKKGGNKIWKKKI